MFEYSNNLRTRWEAHWQAVVLLTPRQKEVLQLVAHGLSNKEVAERLQVSTRTVKNHLTSIYLALGVSGRITAILVWEHYRRSMPASLALA